MHLQQGVATHIQDDARWDEQCMCNLPLDDMLLAARPEGLCTCGRSMEPGAESGTAIGRAMWPGGKDSGCSTPWLLSGLLLRRSGLMCCPREAAAIS